jgi:hypothetical protein
MALASISYIFWVFIEGAIAFVGKGGAITFINKGSLAIRGRLFKTAKAGVNKHNLKQQLMIYKLKSPLVLINSLISVSNHSIQSSSWVMLYSTYSTNLLFFIKDPYPITSE